MYNMSQLQRVTKQQAVKLKEAGFDWETDAYYYQEAETPVISNYDNWNKYGNNSKSAAPLELACKWLRKVKGIDVLVNKTQFKGRQLYYFGVYWPTGEYPHNGLNKLGSYEAAQSAGLDVALDFKK